MLFNIKDDALSSSVLFCCQIVISIVLASTPISTLTADCHMEHLHAEAATVDGPSLLSILMLLHYWNTTCTQFYFDTQPIPHPAQYLLHDTQSSHHHKPRFHPALHCMWPLALVDASLYPLSRVQASKMCMK